MAIKKIKITNFKSFKNLEVELGNFNVLIGANASGKSNFIQIFRFLRDITNDGLNNAISMQGGIEYLRNINIGSDENFSVTVVSDQKYERVTARREETGLIGMEIYETIYKFVIKLKKKGGGFEITEDKLTQKFNIVKLEIQKKGIEKKQNLGQGKITFSNVKGRIHIESILPNNEVIKEDDIIPPFMKEEKLEPKALLLIGRSFFFRSPLFRDVSIYSFDPKLPKRATPITGKADLEEEGGNLAIVLKNIIENTEKKRKFSNLVKDCLPFIDNLDIEKFADKSLLFNLREIYTKRQYLPASLISDGTINIIALIIALYFEERPLTIIEEPERSIHPHLISKIINMMKDASKKKQIIVITHNPEMLKNAGLENILLVSRDKEGFSTISRPTDKEEVKAFLKNEIGIEELYVQNLLEG